MNRKIKREQHSFSSNGVFPLLKILTMLYAPRILAPDLPDIVYDLFEKNIAIRITALVFASWVFGNDIITSVFIVFFLFFIVEGLVQVQKYIQEIKEASNEI
jgi:hypothetical protein